MSGDSADGSDASDAGDSVSVRTARPGEAQAVAGVLDAAMLRTDELGPALARDDVLVATAGERLLGALVLVPRDGDGSPSRLHVDAVAVRPNRRGQGIGRALVEAAADRCDAEQRLTAGFGANVRPFYESLGFEVRERDGRLFGVR
ncbi:GNAT family N-acetyltransferase [Haloarchaeobius sp. HRN-SO-5]|uniref:GNAT family N-acetyltransferase n=1 Tax=Haloarchaeobius sp. HRN-SO-5 TaxID=3446118 RepID=UPI003EB80CDE